MASPCQISSSLLLELLVSWFQPAIRHFAACIYYPEIDILALVSIIEGKPGRSKDLVHVPAQPGLVFKEIFLTSLYKLVFSVSCVFSSFHRVNMNKPSSPRYATRSRFSAPARLQQLDLMDPRWKIPGGATRYKPFGTRQTSTVT